MALVKPKTRETIQVSIEKGTLSEMDQYAKWAGVTRDDIAEFALTKLFSVDPEWFAHKNGGAAEVPMGKVEFIRKIYTEVAAKKHGITDQEPGNVSAKIVREIAKNVYKRLDIADGTYSAQVSWCNRLLRNEKVMREHPDEFARLQRDIEALCDS
jgi:hypothetical protein